MLLVILGFVIVIGLAVVLLASLSHVGDEPGAHRFNELPSEDEHRR